MAGYGYQPRNSVDDWSKPIYGSDHVCRPVIIDAEGRKRPIVSYSPNQNSEYYVTRTTETIVQEKVVSPFASEASRPKFGPMSASTWRQTTKPTAYGSEFSDYNNNSDWKKPNSNNGYRSDVYDYDDSYGKYGSNNNNGLNHTYSTYNNAYPPNSNLSKPTSDIPAAIEILKEVAEPLIATNPRYKKAIDTIEAAKRYGNFGKLNFSPKPYSAGNNY